MENNQKTPLSWEKVEKYLAEKTDSGNVIALLETEKIFQKVLGKLNFPGKTLEQKIRGLKFVLSNFEEFETARKVYQKSLSDLDFLPSPEEIEKVLSIYYKTIEEIISWQKEKKSFFVELKIKLATIILQPRQFFKKFLIILIGFFFIIFVLDSTKAGRAFVSILVKISHFIFSWVLFVVLLLVGLAIIIIGALFYLESRKKEKITKIES